MEKLDITQFLKELSLLTAVWPCLDGKKFWKKNQHHMFGHMHRVLNKVYL